MGGTVDTPNVDAIMRDIRARVARETVPPPAPSEGPPSFGCLSAQEEVVVRDGWNLWDVELASPRGGVVGAAISAVKKAVRRLLAPVLDKQMTFNRTVADLVCDLRERTTLVIANQAQAREAIEQARSAVEGAVLAETMALRERLDRLEARHDRPVEGPMHAVRERRRRWVAHFTGRRSVLDLSAGRGEFLELLTEAGIPGRGVTDDRDLARLCRDKGLAVAHEDALAALSRSPEGALDGIFCADLVARLPLARLMAVLGACHRALAPGAPLIVEASNVVDPRNIRPLPPALLRTLLELSGFAQIEVIFAEPDARATRIPQLEDTLYGSPDYALVARGAAPPMT